jgi:RNA polymerase sigma-70 factor (ECF subfamily)
MESDLDIVRRVRSGQVDDFEILLRRYSAQVFKSVGRRVPVGDVPSVAQDVFVSAFRSLETYEGRQPFGHWLMRIALRRCCDYWRARGRDREATGPDGEEDLSDWMERVSRDVSREAFVGARAREDACEAVHGALARLDAEDRALVEGIYFEDQPLQAMADALGWSLAKVKVRAHRARRKLRTVLERELNRGRREATA